MTTKKTVIHWFRKGHRIHDNPALKQACDLVNSNPTGYVLRPIFILDPDILRWMKVGPNRMRFLHESLSQLDDNLKTINSRLYVIRGSPDSVFTLLFDEWNVAMLTFESDIEPYAKKRDALVERQAAERNVTVKKEVSHTIFDPDAVLGLNCGRPIVSYRSFLAVIDKLTAPDPVATPRALTPPESPPKDSFEQSNPTCYELPLLDEVVANVAELLPSKYPGGETEALARMERYLNDPKWICAFEKPNTSPNSLEPSTTVLSPYLKFGCLSSRLLYKRLRATLAKNPKHTKPPVSLVGQLLWREFYYSAAAGEPNFDRMIGNAICYQIPWKDNADHLEAWTHGRTGYPFIDAIMRQLRQEGWIHHLARHAVACFLTRGDLWISWEAGQKVFEELLLDADWALNAGNWMWLSASAFFHQYFRVYSPIVFGKKTDKDGSYIRKYVPELRNYPAETIYEPWKAKASDQKKYGCVVGKDYPQRIVIHEDIYKVNLAKMSQAYKVNKKLRAETKEEMGADVKTLRAIKRACKDE